MKVKFYSNNGLLFALRVGLSGNFKFIIVSLVVYILGHWSTVYPPLMFGGSTPIESQYVSLFGVRIEMSAKSVEIQISLIAIIDPLPETTRKNTMKRC